MLNFVKSHICTVRFSRNALILLLVVSHSIAPLERNELKSHFEELDPNGLNFRITNELSEFFGE